MADPQMTAAEIELLALLNPLAVTQSAPSSLSFAYESPVTGLASTLTISLPDDYPASPPALGFESHAMADAHARQVGELEAGEPCLLRVVDAFKSALDAGEDLCPTCSICLCAITARVDKFASMCEHAFHVTCFNEWRQSTIERKASSTHADEMRARRKQRESAAENDVKLAEQAVRASVAEKDALLGREALLRARKEDVKAQQPAAPAKAAARKPVADVRNEADEDVADAAEIDRRLAQLSLDKKAAGQRVAKAKAKQGAAAAALDRAVAALAAESRAELANMSVPCPICRADL